MEKPTRVQLKRRRQRRFLRLVLFLILSILVAYFMLETTYFNIENFKVEGINKLEKEQIINSSNIIKGENIFKINKKLLKENVITLPYVKNIEIKRKLPNTIIFKIEERIGALQTRSISTMLLVDIEGYILEELDIVDENLPNITGFDLSNIILGDNIFIESNKNEVVDFIGLSNEAKLLNKSSKIDMSELDNINIQLINGISVAFGTLDNVKYKLSLLNEILIDIEEKQIPCKMIIMNKGDNPILVLDDKSEG